MRLSERFVDNCILINSKSTTKEEVLNELVDTLCSAYKLEHRNEIFDAVWTREQSRSTGIGCGLAVPHAKIDCVDRMCMSAATIEGGLDFADRKPRQHCRPAPQGPLLCQPPLGRRRCPQGPDRLQGSGRIFDHSARCRGQIPVIPLTGANIFTTFARTSDG